MPTPETLAPHEDRAAKLGARVALAAFVILSSAFALSSTWQLTRAVFFDSPPSSTFDNPHVAAGTPCTKEPGP